MFAPVLAEDLSSAVAQVPGFPAADSAEKPLASGSRPGTLADSAGHNPILEEHQSLAG